MKILKEILICVLIFQIILDAASESTAREGHRNSTLSKTRLKKFQNAYRLYGGQSAQVNSMCVGMKNDDYYELEDYSYLLNFSPQCFVTRASIYVDTDNVPPTVDSSHFYTGLCVRPNCDTNYHPSEILLNNVNYYNPDNYHNNIAVFKTKDRVIYNTRCGGPPLEPAWISCDKNGPPANYTDCFYASFGNTNSEQEFGSEFAPINKVNVRVLSPADCQTASQESDPMNFDPVNEVCITDSSGLSPNCDIDRNSFLFCKYWDQGTNQGWGSNSGWKSDSKGQAANSNNGWGWNPPPKRQNLLAIGHRENYYGAEEDCSSTNFGVDLMVKYGAQNYRNLFAKCGYYCSTELEKGYRCQGNPPKSLGPVYCHPEKIPTHNGWGPTGNSHTGWSS